MRAISHIVGQSAFHKTLLPVKTLNATRNLKCKLPRMSSRPRPAQPLKPGRTKTVEKIQLIPINGLQEPMKPTTKILPPQKKIIVDIAELPGKDGARDFWGIGCMSYPEKTDPVDDFDTNITLNVKTFRPGDKAPKYVRKNAYDTRPFKYLWTLDHNGLNVVREMLRFKSSRGIVLHSKISPMAVAGGEVWFCPKEDAIYLNFCSGRYPLKNTAAIDKLAMLWLNFYENVYVIVPPERYGEITPVWYQRTGSNQR